jgi:uncharacterized membrane protein
MTTTDSSSDGPARVEVGAAIRYGWEAFKARPGPLLGAAAIVLGIDLVLNFSAQMTAETPVEVVLALVRWATSVFFARGFLRIGLSIVRGGTPTAGTLFQLDGTARYFGAAALTGVIVIVGLTLLVIPGVIALACLFFAGLAVIDCGDRPLAALRRSYEVTRGRRFSVIVLAVAITAITMLGLLACGVGLLVAYPVGAIATAYAWVTLQDQPVSPGVELAPPQGPQPATTDHIE